MSDDDDKKKKNDDGDNGGDDAENNNNNDSSNKALLDSGIKKKKKLKPREPDRVLVLGKPDYERCDNKVITSRYTIVSFLPVVRN